MKPSEVIDTVLIDLLPDATRWVQGRYHQNGLKDAKYCLLGAIGVAMTGNPLGYGGPVYRAVGDAIQEQEGEPLALMSFNDRRGRTYDEVRAVLEKARAHLWERGQ